MTSTKPDAGVIATNPATAPEQAPNNDALPRRKNSNSIHANVPVAAATCVTSIAIPARPSAANADPALNPNHPTHNNDALPAQNTKVNGFWMDVTEVTNKEFQTFVNATNYITVAERKIDWEELKKLEPEGTPKPNDEDLEPGSIVFVAPHYTVSLDDYSQWWKWIKGANWKHPEGPESSFIS